jgi:hypothetical protein
MIRQRAFAIAFAIALPTLGATGALAQAAPPPPPSPQLGVVLQAEQHRAAVLEGAKHNTNWIKHG